ncbi:DNA-binding IclR family transcriptional regulator [Agrobacterium sp. SORGH_AS 745]|nr:DNA-binding IclR family transcriptional regulator [Agrobacterium sp. SORGH_AS_0745]
MEPAVLPPCRCRASSSPLLDRLSEEIGHSTSVSILDDTEIVYVARAAQQRVMSIALMPGSRLPAYCTSMGRVLLSALTPERQREVLEHSRLVARTEKTMTGIDALLDELEATRNRGYALIDQEVEIGLRSIAVPVKTVRGQTVAALNVGLAASVASMDDLVERYLPPLLSVQRELGRMLA